MWSLFCSHARQHTAPATLAMLPKPLRVKFKQALKLAEPAWWDTGQIWKQWPVLVEQLGLAPEGPAKL